MNFEPKMLKGLVKKLRETLGMSQQEFSEALGKAHGTIQSYEIGRASPPPTELAKMAILAYGRQQPDFGDTLSAAMIELLGPEVVSLVRKRGGCEWHDMLDELLSSPLEKATTRFLEEMIPRARRKAVARSRPGS